MNRNDARDKMAFDKVTKARVSLVVVQPFYGALALQLELIEEDPKTKGPNCTMWTDGIHMGYFPTFVHECNEKQLEGVVAHEVTHCAYKHFMRLMHRNPVIFNWAGDYVINSDLKKAGFVLPDPHLYDPKYDGMSSEEVYEKLKQDLQQKLKQQAQQQKGNKGQKGQGRGRAIPSTDLDLEGLEDLMVGSMDRCGEVRQAPGNQVEQNTIEREWDATVRMAVNVAKRANAGTVPANLERLVSALAQPRISWRELTRQFIDNSMSKDYSWARPNRRLISRNMYFPGFVSDSLHHLVFCVDTSGSISNDMLMKMGNEIGGALNDGTADKITVVYADTKVAHVDEFQMGDIVHTKMHGGGGTDFADTFRWIKKNASDAQCIIYLTDMMTSSFGEDLNIPTMWAAFLPQSMLARIRPPFGTVVQVDTSEW